jgi:hypothetical protein
MPDKGFTHPDSLPFHYRDNGQPCQRAGQLSDSGHCPDGCDHADHYSNDGHEACVEEASKQ